MRLAGAHDVERLLRAAVPWGALLTVLLWLPLVSSPDHSWDDADPEILNGAYRLAQGQPLYHPIERAPWVVNPYTPLYPAVVALGLRLTGLSYLPARAVSLASTLAIGLALLVLARRAGRRAREVGWATCLLLLVPAVLYNVARPHPQMLAVALSLWSLVLFESRSRFVADVLSALLAVLAVYTKQTQIVLPVALGLWLAWRDRPRLLRYGAVVALFGLAPVPFLQSATRGAFLFCVTSMNALPYDSRRIPLVFLHFAGILGGFLALAVARLAQRLRRSAIEPLDAYFALLVPVTLATLGRAGAHTQYLVELVVVAVLYLIRSGGLRFPVGRERLAAAQLALVMLYAPAFVLLEEGPFDRASLRVAPSVRALLASAPGPVLSQQGSFALFTRGEIHVQLFHFAALAREGRWDERPLLREVEQQRLAWVVTEFPLEDPLAGDDNRERFTPELYAALARCYARRAQLGPYYVYEPRTAAAGTGRPAAPEPRRVRMAARDARDRTAEPAAVGEPGRRPGS